MYCDKNRIYCNDCSGSYIEYNYSNQLRSRGHIDNVNKKRCHSSKNHDLTCCMNKLSLKSNDNTQSNNHRKIDPDILLEIYRKHYSGCYNDKESIVEARAILSELYRINAITWREYIDFLGKHYY